MVTRSQKSGHTQDRKTLFYCMQLLASSSYVDYLHSGYGDCDVHIGVSLRRLYSNMPPASSCGAAISAACHPPDDTDVSWKPVMCARCLRIWGIAKIGPRLM